jgi:hypothetical protein
MDRASCFVLDINGSGISRTNLEANLNFYARDWQI